MVIVGMAVTAIATIALPANPVMAGILRHDVPRADFFALGDRAEYRSVISIVRDDSGSAAPTLVGSGVVVAPQWILTAAHVFNIGDGKRYRIALDGDSAIIDSIVPHPQYHAARDSVYVDLALVRITRAMPASRVAAIASQRVSLGTEVVSVGYGRLSIGNDPASAVGGRRHAFQNTIDTLVSGKSPHSQFGADLDHPTDTTMSTLGSGRARAMEGIVNGGDSGGGLFVVDRGQTRLAGIVATTSHDRKRLEAFATYGFYGSISFWTRLDNQLDWIHTVARVSPP